MRDLPDEMSRAVNWILSDDTGISSKTIWAVMMGADYPDHDIPWDVADIGRCLRLLAIIPEWADRLAEVAAAHPYWAPMISAWDELQALYEKESPNQRCPELYARMREIRGEVAKLRNEKDPLAGTWAEAASAS